MATNMEKITKALVNYGLSDVNGIAEVTKISKPAIYKLAAQNNATFKLNNGIMILKETYGAIEEAISKTKEEHKNRKVECEKEHWPDYLKTSDGRFPIEIKNSTYDNVGSIIDEIANKFQSFKEHNNDTLIIVMSAIINELKRRSEEE